MSDGIYFFSAIIKGHIVNNISVMFGKKILTICVGIKHYIQQSHFFLSIPIVKLARDVVSQEVDYFLNLTDDPYK